MAPLNRDQALNVVVPLDRDARKLLLNVLCEEMHSDDLEEVLKHNGFVPNDE